MKETYDYDLLDNTTIDVETMNETAIEAQRFMNGMSSALRSGLKIDDKIVRGLIRDHIDVLNKQGQQITHKDYATQARFFPDDDFHRNMLEAQQTGLAYFHSTAAESFAAATD